MFKKGRDVYRSIQRVHFALINNIEIHPHGSTFLLYGYDLVSYINNSARIYSQIKCQTSPTTTPGGLPH